MNRKQLIILFAGTVGVLLIFVIFLTFQQLSQKPAQSTVTNVTADQKAADGGIKPGVATSGNGKKVVTPTPLPKQLSAAETVRAFYYATAVGNPLANGAFKTNQYLTGTFKDNIGEWYDNGNKPVFCPINRRPNVTVGKENKQYYDKEYLTQEFISDATTGQDLYLVILQSRDNVWQIFDITCL